MRLLMVVAYVGEFAFLSQVEADDYALNKPDYS